MKTEYPISRSKMYVVLFVANLFLTVFRLLILPELPPLFHTVTSIASLFGFWIIWEFILRIGDFLENKFPIAIQPNKRIIIQVIATYLLTMIIGELLRIGSEVILHVQFPEVLQAFGYLLFFLLSLIMNLIYFGTIYFFNWKFDLTNLANMQREQAIVKYDVLKNQLNPHFLFNALTSLNSLIFENQQLASDFLQQLSKVYRYVLQNKEKATVTLQVEIDFIRSFIFLLKTRFIGAVEFNIDLKDLEKQKEIVPVTLQILIENAIKHNIVSKEIPLIISIYGDGDYLFIQNNLHKKAQVESSNKQGLENLKSLYRYMTDKPVEIQETDRSFTVKIPLI
jgi:two-component system, LytTR family, sensor kinase